MSKHIAPVKATVNQGIEFLMYLFNAGEKHGNCKAIHEESAQETT